MGGKAHQWTQKEQQAIVLDLLRDKETLAGLAHENQVPAGQILAWKHGFCHRAGTGRRPAARPNRLNGKT